MRVSTGKVSSLVIVLQIHVIICTLVDTQFKTLGNLKFSVVFVSDKSSTGFLMLWYRENGGDVLRCWQVARVGILN